MTVLSGSKTISGMFASTINEKRFNIKLADLKIIPEVNEVIMPIVRVITMKEYQVVVNTSTLYLRRAKKVLKQRSVKVL